MKQPQDKGTSAWPVLDTLQTSDFLLVGLLSQLQEITIHFHRPLKDRLTQNRTTRVHNQVWALAVCRWFEFEGYLGLTTGNFHMGTGSDPGALVNTKTGKWRFNPQKTCDETLDPFWSIPICAMVKTWYIGYGYPSNNGNPDSILCRGRELQSLYACQWKKSVFLGPESHNMLLSCWVLDRSCVLNQQNILDPKTEPPSLFPWARTCQHYSRNGRRL
jgi:hypothetical protein